MNRASWLGAAVVAVGLTAGIATAQPAEPAVPAGAAVELPGAPDSVFGAMREQGLMPIHYFHVSKRTTYPQIGQAIGELMPKIGPVRAAAKLHSGGPMIFVYRDGGPDGVTLDIGQPVPEGFQPAGEAQVRVIPPQRSVSLIYQGPLRDIGRATGELDRQRRAAKLPEPIETREFYLRFDGDASPRNITLIQQVLPPDPEHPPMTDPITQSEPMRLMTVPAMRYFQVSTEADPNAIPLAFGRLTTPLEQAVAEAGLSPEEMIAIYENSGPGKPLVLRNGYAVRADAQPAGTATVKELPEFPCGSAVYQGSIMGLGAAIQSLEQQLRGIGLTPNGQYREIYLYWEDLPSANNVMQLQVGYDEE